MKTIDAKRMDLRESSKELNRVLDGTTVGVKNAQQLHGFASGLVRGEVLVIGNSGDYLGALNNGAVIRVTENAGKYAADNMTAGMVIIEGDADYGPAQYCYGGTVMIRGSAGDFAATMNKGATVIIGGDVGDNAGTYMLKGDLIVIGDAGENFANYLIKGNVYIGGEWKSIGANTRIEPLTDADITKLRTLFEKFDLQADPSTFQKIVAESEKPFYKS